MAVNPAAAWPQPSEIPRKITVLGSTGSIGCSTVDLIGRNPEAFEVEALTAHRNLDVLLEQSRRLRPRMTCRFRCRNSPSRTA